MRDGQQPELRPSVLCSPRSPNKPRECTGKCRQFNGLSAQARWGSLRWPSTSSCRRPLFFSRLQAQVTEQVAGRGAPGFLAAFPWDGAWSDSWRDHSESFRTTPPHIWCQRLYSGVVLRRAAVGSKRLSLCGRYARRCAVGPANRSCMANRLSSVRRSVYRHWGGADIGLDVAG